MLTEYIEKAMSLAQVEKMEDGRYFASIPLFKGLWADGDTKDECLNELHSSFEEWLVIALREDDELPELGQVSLNFGGKGRDMDKAQSRLEAMLAMSLYETRSEEIKKHLEKLSEEHGEPKVAITEVRAMMDRALGRRTLSGEIYKMRQGRS